MRCQLMLPMLLGLGLLAFPAGHFAAAQTETERFDTEASAAAAGWLANPEGQNPQRDCDGCVTDLGWKNSNFAGASAGEAGGLLHRAGDLPVGFYADTTIGQLTLDDSFSANGKVYLRNIDFDGYVHWGFIDAQRLLQDPLDFGAHLGFRLLEPTGGVAANFRWGLTFSIDTGENFGENNAFFAGIPQEIPVDFLLEYDPDGGDGFGLVTLTVADEPPFEYALDEDQRIQGATFTGFGIFTGSFQGSASSAAMEIFIDDVTYTSLDTRGPVGDFNRDGVLDAADINLLTAEVRAGTNRKEFDLDNNALVNQEDRRVWVEDLKNTYFGDANLDREFNSTDFVVVFQAGQYEDATPGNSQWETGDWTGDGEFDSSDFVAAFQGGGFERGPRAAAAAVPEPSSVMLSLLAVLAGLAVRPRSLPSPSGVSPLDA